jgi:chromosome segregation protein
MLIRKLRLSGFKSFVEPAELRIEPGLTGVVGPNGCGKSNLLEAIRWVMGENSPKSMRSGGMDDVIFAGTAQRPARDFAEVTLQAVSDGGEEMEVTRRIERGAGSAYRVNGRDVRAKDVALVFADAATGAHSPALVSQGRIAAVIAARPAERRAMLEEAAGIAGLHVRRRDAEGKLKQTETNLARLQDLMAGIEGQIATLRRQARQAERYRALSDRIRVAEARVLFTRWREAASAAEAAHAEARAATAAVEQAQAAARHAQETQVELAEKLAKAREELADRRDDASAHGHRMAALSGQLDAVEQRRSDLNRQRGRLEQDRGDADRLTRDAAESLARLERDLALGQATLAAEEQRRPELARRVEHAEQAGRAAELALAKATADHAGLEAQWRVAQAELAQAEARSGRLDQETRRLEGQSAALGALSDADNAVAGTRRRAENATARLHGLRAHAADRQARKEELSAVRDQAASAVASARAELTGFEREWQALERDREARARQAQKSPLPAALDLISAEPGYERALAAVLGRDARAPLGSPEPGAQGRFWTGAEAPHPLEEALAAHVTRCPPELAARLALVHVVAEDDGRPLKPGEWLVTRAGRLRRWDGFVAHGEGAAEAARLEADNRRAELEQQLPGRRAILAEAESVQNAVQAELTELQRLIVAAEREIMQLTEAERQALRSLDQAEAERERIAARAEELAGAQAALSQQQAEAEAEIATARERLAALPDPERGRASLETARAHHEMARTAYQAAVAALAAHDQALAVGRERITAQRGDISGWQARSGESARRLAETARRLEEIAEELAVVEARAPLLMREIEGGETVRERLTGELARAESIVLAAGTEAQAAEGALATLTEALAAAREARAGTSARAENAEARRTELARAAGERFACPPAMLASRIAFDAEQVADAATEAAAQDSLIAERERIGPVNLVAADELAKLEAEHGNSAAEQADLAEAVNRLRGSIGNLNREGRERLRVAFAQVDTHFRRLFTRLFEGGQANLALIDSDDPLEAGLEIFAQPPGKRLQSLTLLSGGEQALTAIALIFALFLTNPAPICVLDEVDAPLDDANIDRFCDLLDAMTRETDTRYLIVTHNAVTMSRMHRLFGVTMVERGVSRLVSVDLGGAEELLAAE